MAFSNNRPFFGVRRDDYNRNNQNMRNSLRSGFHHDDNRRKMYNEPLLSPRERFDSRLLSQPDFRNRPDVRIPPPIGRGNLGRDIGPPPIGRGNLGRGIGPPPQKKPAQPPLKNSFSKFRNLEEFKDFRRSLKMRRSIEEDDMDFPKRRRQNDSVDFIFISPIEILELKDNIYISLRKNLSNPRYEVEEICQMFSRFQYHLCFKDYNTAKSFSKRKIETRRQLFSCQPCDCSFTDKAILDIHLRSGLHLQTSRIYAKVLKLGLDYFNHYTNLSSILVEAPITEKTGILVSLNDDEVNYSQLDVTNMEKDQFVLAALEKGMAKYWPHPQSPYFCRCCNYSEFSSQALLDRHMQSARHLGFDRHYRDAFCIICQYHYGDVEQMRNHMDTPVHNKASHLMEYSKKHASEYWNYWHDKDKNLIPVYGDVEEKPSSNTDNYSIKIDDNLRKETFDKPPENLRIPFVDEFESPHRKKDTVSEDVNILKDEPQDTKPNVKLENSTDVVVKSDFLEAPQEIPKDPSSLDIEVYKEYAMRHKKPQEMKIEEEPEISQANEPETKQSDLDEYIVPLTGFMCTVCHETLSDRDAAISHKETNSHQSNVKTHALLFGP